MSASTEKSAPEGAMRDAAVAALLVDQRSDINKCNSDEAGISIVSQQMKAGPLADCKSTQHEVAWF